MALAKRGDGVNLRDVSEAGLAGGPLQAEYPALYEFLTLEVWPEGGGERMPGSLLVFSQDGLLKARLVDNDRDEVAFWSAQGLHQLLQRVDRDLREGHGDWRRQRPMQARGKK